MSSPVSSEPAGATPAMRQYFDAKRQYRDAIVFFRMGDFYEMFYEDALTAARALELTLTSRSKDSTGGAIPMCGVPFHAADGYIARLVSKGFRVAVCEQVEDPKKAKGLVRREVVRVVSPGTLTDAGYLEAREPAFLHGASRRPTTAPGFGVALLDLSTGEFTTAEYRGRGRHGRRSPTSSPSCARARSSRPTASTTRRRSSTSCASSARVTHGRRWTFDYESARRTLLEQLQSAEPAGVRPRGPSGRGLAPPARSCSTCATRRRPTSRTSARSRSAPAPTA